MDGKWVFKFAVCLKGVVVFKREVTLHECEAERLSGVKNYELSDDRDVGITICKI